MDELQKPQEEKVAKNNFSIPAAIILAGLLIAFGIYMSGRSSQSAQTAPSATQAATAATAVKPVTSTDHILGDPNAPITVIEYADLECPFCKEFEGTMQTIMDSYGKQGEVAWVYRNFTVHSLAPNEADAAECANALGGNTVYWNYINDIFATTTSEDDLNPAVLPAVASELGINVTKFNACLASNTYLGLVQQQTSDAVAAGGQGTPFSVMLLKTPLTAAKQNTITAYIASNGLSQNVSISTDGKQIDLNGALPLQIVTYLIDTILAK